MCRGFGPKKTQKDCDSLRTPSILVGFQPVSPPPRPVSYFSCISLVQHKVMGILALRTWLLETDDARSTTVSPVNIAGIENTPSYPPDLKRSTPPKEQAKFFNLVRCVCVRGASWKVAFLATCFANNQKAVKLPVGTIWWCIDSLKSSRVYFSARRSYIISISIPSEPPSPLPGVDLCFQRGH